MLILLTLKSIQLNIPKTFYFILRDVAEKRNGTVVCHLLENQEVQDLNLSSDYKGMCIMIHVWVKRKSLSLWQVPIILEYGLEHGKNGQRLSLLRRLTPPDHPHFTDSNLVFHSGFSAICNAHLCPTTMLFCGTQLLMIISQPRSFIFIISWCKQLDIVNFTRSRFQFSKVLLKGSV